ncbi:hypothetical protein BAUCODRAFT_435364 [Baudoinia panamericana UAMH 10762]|uniref:Uncharacterized protein n=1 Tax=Baudoinia panamericana (strain UAMH 10762) TaxID=717646 RepID=M2NCU5_BAUPA|nr:uncharacterized protein BAUCODRAFT_435364 [Baudoinia panamericana UAMH 10762]EMC97004.1 hypothetical protein BAUCODRAFT_435364 [Baudoinia panamericana UAMH 10762]
MAPSGEQEIIWNAANDRKLLLVILSIQDVKPDREALVKVMTTEDSKLTASP